MFWHLIIWYSAVRHSIIKRLYNYFSSTSWSRNQNNTISCFHQEVLLLPYHNVLLNQSTSCRIFLTIGKYAVWGFFYLLHLKTSWERVKLALRLGPSASASIQRLSPQKRRFILDLRADGVGNTLTHWESHLIHLQSKELRVWYPILVGHRQIGLLN